MNSSMKSSQTSSMTSSTTRSTYTAYENRCVDMLGWKNPDFDPRKHMPRNKVVAVLCPGPNLDVYDPESEYGLVIGVNRAVVFHECDWMAAGDIEWTERLSVFTKEWCDVHGYPKGEPKVFCHGFEGIKALDRVIGPPPAGFELFETFPGKLGWRWSTFSLFGAIALAYRLGAEIIHCYGVAWEGNEDMDGLACKSRNAARWTTEQLLFEQFRDFLVTKGVKLCRILEPIGEETDVEPEVKEFEGTYIYAGMTLGVEGGDFNVVVTEDKDHEDSEVSMEGGEGSVDSVDSDVVQEIEKEPDDETGRIVQSGITEDNEPSRDSGDGEAAFGPES